MQSYKRVPKKVNDGHFKHDAIKISWPIWDKTKKTVAACDWCRPRYGFSKPIAIGRNFKEVFVTWDLKEVKTKV